MKFTSTMIFGSALLMTCLPNVFAAPAHIIPLNTTDSSESTGSDVIVMLAVNETRTVNQVITDMGYNVADAKHIYDNGAFRGFAMNVKPSHAVMLQSAENVHCFEPESIVRLAVIPQKYTRVSRMSRTIHRKWYSTLKDAMPDFPITHYLNKLRKRDTLLLQQNVAPWSLQRASSQAAVQTDGRADTALTYQFRFNAVAGQGVDIYMLDTGINVAHQDFGGRAQMIYSVDGDLTDHEGHGTHTAGIAGSNTFGMAKNANLLGVKIFRSDGSGALSDTIAGISTVVTRHQTRQKDANFVASVISMSLGAATVSPGMQMAISSAIAAGIHFSVAAGNDNADACGYTPAGVSATLPILSVGASTIQDSTATFSNWGSCVNIYAPGTEITSTFIPGTTSTAVLQGTSMACPLVTGLLANAIAVTPSVALNPAGAKALLLARALNGPLTRQDSSGNTIVLPLANNGFPGNPQS